MWVFGFSQTFFNSNASNELRPKYTTWLIIFDLSDSLAVLRKIRYV